MTQKTHAQLCPNCRKLISADEKKCPFCGTAYPHFFLKQFLIKIFKKDSVLILITLMNAFMFSASIFFNLSTVRLDINPLVFLSPDNETLFWLGASGTFPINNYNHWWSLVTANYLHGGLLHIVLNMLALNQIGKLIVSEYGVSRFWIIYTASGVIGYFVSWFLGITFTIGASAAVCGLIGAGLFFGKTQGGDYGYAIYRHISGWILSLFLFGLLVPGINNWAHAGGLLGGVMTAFFLGYNIQPKYKMLHRILAIVCVAITILCLGFTLGLSAFRLAGMVKG
ncbi:MAG: rhomboid family intramembrane serine protease [Candidatus Magnetomorum sp.]|nr:rhomboid family intramembrane serine protease [Candidatus Magnetomorum sp.]